MSPIGPGDLNPPGRVRPPQPLSDPARVGAGLYLASLQDALQQGTRWANFQPNGEPLWSAVRAGIEDSLRREWQAGRLVGNGPQEAFFVRCDRTTMTQADLASGHLVSVVGVALTSPAAFSVLRVAHWTADAHR